VVNDLAILSLPRGAVGREPNGKRMIALRTDIDNRCAGTCSKKGNRSAFWLNNCLWDVRHGQQEIAKANLLALLRLAWGEQRLVLPEQGEVLLVELRSRAKTAGEARWEPNRDRKIITRGALRTWWDKRTAELLAGAEAPAGGKLADKLREVGAADEIVALALEMRRDYAGTMRTPRYMVDGETERLQARVKSEMMTLRTQYAAGQIDPDGLGFLSLCQERLEAVNRDRPVGAEDRTAFLYGCMYDIADRCLHRFTRPR
jgi:hypothetical protein